MYKMNINNIIKIIIFLAIITSISGLLISIISTIFYTKTNKDVEEVYKMLPGYNCGGCGRAGCKEFARAIVEENEKIEKCKPIKEHQINNIKNFLKK